MGRLFWKFFLSIWAAQCAAALAISASFWLKNHARNAQEFDQSPPAVLMLDSAAATLRFGGAPALQDLLRQPHGNRIYAIDQRGNDILGRTIDQGLLAHARRQLERADARPHAVRIAAGADGMRYLLFVPWTDRSFGHGGPRPPRDTWHFPLVPMLFTMLACVVSALLLAWYFAKPIRSLRAAFDAAASGDLDARIAPAMGTRRDELAELGRDFDRMASRLHMLVDGQRRLLHDVSHELRSPLARLQAAIGLARQRPERIDTSLERIERESVRMDRLVGELLTLSRLEAGVVGAIGERVNIGELAADIVDDARFEAEHEGKTVELADCGRAVVAGYAELLHSAIENVVRNAIKHTVKGSSVSVAVDADTAAGWAHVVVRDMGPGVPEDELDKIFRPFFRSIRPGKNTEGYGLGLAIAKRVIEAHQGSISASNLDTGGLCVAISLPLQRQQTAA
ncbi:MAG TPA: ATP-binding protein [Noviherbaspirillum sp.]|nr:ATP-binding protein [Noviherbaspirillum sp.]